MAEALSRLSPIYARRNGARARNDGDLPLLQQGHHVPDAAARDEETKITGPLAAKLWASGTTSDADLFLVVRDLR